VLVQNAGAARGRRDRKQKVAGREARGLGRQAVDKIHDPVLRMTRRSVSGLRRYGARAVTTRAMQGHSSTIP
jgi:hypothetical protein